MRKTALFFLISFIFYLIGHLIWSWSLVYTEPLFLNQDIETWMINIPFGFFAVFGVIASLRLYKYFK